MAINDDNMIVGTTGSSSATTPITYSRAFVYGYDTDTLTVLPVLEGGLRSSANDINEANQIVGSSESATGNRAVMWDASGEVVTDLNDLTSAAADGWVLTSANAINDDGDIAGSGMLNGVAHGFLLASGTIPEPPPVPNLAPVAVIGADVYSGRAPLTVNFDASGSDDPDGNIVSYSWDVGCASVSSTPEPPGTCEHTFLEAGTYRVTLTVTDDGGLSASDSVSIRVRKGRRK